MGRDARSGDHAAPVAAVRPPARAHEGADGSGAQRARRPRHAVAGRDRVRSGRRRHRRARPEPHAVAGRRVPRVRRGRGQRLGRPDRAAARGRGRGRRPRRRDRRREPGLARTRRARRDRAARSRRAAARRAARDRRRSRSHRSAARPPPPARRAPRRRLLRRSRQGRLRRAPRARHRPLSRHGDQGDVRRHPRPARRRVQGRRSRLRGLRGHRADPEVHRRRDPEALEDGRRRLGEDARRACAGRCATSRASWWCSTGAGSRRPATRSRPTGRSRRQIEESFPYEETPDQAQAIIETKADMERPVPMDRLVCGDVGYGKTEVALRAAAKAVFDGKQVAILVPTTLLASQHGQTFRERFANYPVRVEVLSRFLSAKEQTEVVNGVQGRHRRHRDRHAPVALRRHARSRTSGCSWSTRSSASACSTRNGSRGCARASTS